MKGAADSQKYRVLSQYVCFIGLFVFLAVVLNTQFKLHKAQAERIDVLEQTLIEMTESQSALLIEKEFEIAQALRSDIE